MPCVGKEGYEHTQTLFCPMIQSANVLNTELGANRQGNKNRIMKESFGPGNYRGFISRIVVSIETENGNGATENTGRYPTCVCYHFNIFGSLVTASKCF
jgi:hypothetical protein